MAPSSGAGEVADCRRRNCQRAQLVTQAQATYRPPRRPRTVLDEDTYVDSLAAVIKRNFFPDSQRAARHDGAIPSGWSAKLQRDVATLSLEAFQAKYTSEDDASFLDILDRANLDRRERYHWLYTGRRLYAPHVEQAQRRIEARQRLAIESGEPASEDRHAQAADSMAVVPARRPRNALMHGPDQAEHLIDAPPVKYSESQVRIRNLQVPSPAEARARSTRQGSPTGSAFERELRAGQAYLERQRAGQYELLHEDAPPAPAVTTDTAADDGRDERVFEMPAVQRREQTRDRLAARLKRASTPSSAGRHASPLLVHGRRSVSKHSDRRAVLSPAAERLLLRKPTPRTPLTR